MSRIMMTIMFVFNNKFTIAPVGNFAQPLPTSRFRYTNILQKTLFGKKFGSIPIYTLFIRFFPSSRSNFRVCSTRYFAFFKNTINCYIRTIKIFCQLLPRNTMFITFANSFYIVITFFHVCIIASAMHYYNKKINLF